MRLGDLDAVMEIERLSFKSPWSAQVFLEEMARDWAHVDVVRDLGAAAGGRVRQLLAGRRRGAPAQPGDPSRGAAGRPRLAHARPHRRVRPRAPLPAGHAGGPALERRGAAPLPALRLRAVGVRPNYYAEDQEDAIVMLTRRRMTPATVLAFGGLLGAAAFVGPPRVARPRPPRAGPPSAPAGAAARGAIRRVATARAGGRDHVRRLRDPHQRLRVRRRRVRHPQARGDPGDDLRLRPLGRIPP